MAEDNRPSRDATELTRQKSKTPNRIEADTLEPHVMPDRITRIQGEAYRLAERRGFAPGAELDDWLEAERLIDRELGTRGTAR